LHISGVKWQDFSTWLMEADGFWAWGWGWGFWVGAGVGVGVSDKWHSLLE